MTSSLPSHPASCSRITASRCHRIKTLTVRENLLVVVQQGRKTLIAPAGGLEAGRGDALLMARGTQWDVINDPAGTSRYVAWVLVFDDELVRGLEPQLAAGASCVAPACRLAMDEELLEAVRRAAGFQQARPVSDALGRHRLMEVLLLLAERNHRFAPVGQPGWDERVRRLVAQRPQADWSVDALAGAFNVSASTLRRRIGGSGETLAALVREVRLETGLALLQGTRLSIREVALRCGWESHSRFSAAFQERWGFAPSVMRQRLTQNG